jgi:hypothetical protein
MKLFPARHLGLERGEEALNLNLAQLRRLSLDTSYVETQQSALAHKYDEDPNHPTFLNFKFSIPVLVTRSPSAEYLTLTQPLLDG